MSGIPRRFSCAYGALIAQSRIAARRRLSDSHERHRLKQKRKTSLLGRSEKQAN